MLNAKCKIFLVDMSMRVAIRVILINSLDLITLLRAVSDVLLTMPFFVSLGQLTSVFLNVRDYDIEARRFFSLRLFV